MSESEKTAVRELLQKLRSGDKDSRARYNAPAQVTVNAPDGARVFVDGVPAPARTFRTPALQPGREYYYDFRVELAGNDQALTRRVTVAAGREVMVDFTLPVTPPTGVARR
jgi:uncharacterized protein (TIGR03000 family)